MDFAVFLQGRSDDEAGGFRKKIGQVLEGGATTDQQRCPGGRGVCASQVFRVGPVAGAATAEDKGIGATALPGIAGFVLNGIAGGEGGRVLDVDIGQDFDFIGANLASETEKCFGNAVEDTLVGHAGTDQDIHTDKIGSDGMGDGHGADAIVAEKIDTQGAGEKLAGFHRECRQGGESGGSGGSGGKRSVAKIFQYDAVNSAISQGLKITPHDFSSLGEFSGGAGCAGESGEVDDTNQKGVLAKEGEAGHRAILKESVVG